MAWPWSELGLEEGADLAAVERAYAERRKTIHPEDDPVGFQALHGAYLMAACYARQAAENAAAPPAPKPSREEAPRTPPPAQRPASAKYSAQPAGADTWKRFLRVLLPILALCVLSGFGALLFQPKSDPVSTPPPPAAAVSHSAAPAASTEPAPSPIPWDELSGLLEEDLGVRLSSITATVSEGGVVFMLEDDPSFRFQAAASGVRNMEKGRRGYKTNYADALLYYALDGFSEEWELPLYFGRALTETIWRGETTAEFPPYYNLVIPTTGAEEALTALGETLDGLFASLPDGLSRPQATLSIGRAGLEHYFYYDFSARSEEPGIDAGQMTDAYTAQFASDYAEYAIKTSGAAEQDLGPDYVLIPMGLVAVSGEPYYRFDAAESPESGTVQYQYFVSADGKYVKCVPIPWPEGLVPQPGGGAPEAFGYFLTKDFISLPGGADISVDRYFDWSKLP